MATARDMLRKARRRAGLTQRALAARTGIAQPTIARIERGTDDPRVSTVARLLAACGESLEAVGRRGDGIDTTLFDELLRLSPAERVRLLTEENRSLDALDRASR
jgi:predicted transcriptional regulator